jgi:hypothetical protein
MRLEYTWEMDEDCEGISHGVEENNQTSFAKQEHIFVYFRSALERNT